MSNTNEKDDNLTVSRVYDTLKSPTFLKNLYWDILSDIKEKNTYKLMREIAEGVIDQNMEILDGLNSNTEADNMHRKTMVAEISMMSYTIDRVFSKILFMKLEKVCKEQIVNIIQELKDEGKIPENVWSRLKMNSDIPGSQTSTENKVVTENLVKQKKEEQRVPTRVGKRRRKVNSNYNIAQDIKKANSNKEILDDLKKVNSMKYTDENKDTADDKKENVQKRRSGGKIKESPNENIPITDAVPSLKTLTQETDNLDVSDAESEISLGCASVASVSSVHTSDLSSFDDEISLSSDDENGEKKRIPLKDVLERYSLSGPSDISTPKPDARSSKSPKSKKKSNEKVKQKKNETKPVPVNDTAKRALRESTLFETSNENGLSKRARKPNSRYSSGNMLCPIVKVKERKKSSTLPKANGQIDNADHSPQKKKAKVDDICVDVVTITQSINEGSSKDNVKTPAKQPVHTNIQKTPAKQTAHTNIQKTPAKQVETTILFGPRSASRSLTSRRSAPLTLFST